MNNAPWLLTLLSVTPQARLHLDYVESFNEDVAVFDVRRGRAGFEATAGDALTAKLDWNLDAMILHETWLNVGGDKAALRVGWQKVPIEGAWLESSNRLAFLERPMLTSVLGTDRQWTAMLHGGAQGAAYAISVVPSGELAGRIGGTRERQEGFISLGYATRDISAALKTGSGAQIGDTEVLTDGTFRGGVDHSSVFGALRIDLRVGLAFTPDPAQGPRTTTGATALVGRWILTGEPHRLGKGVEAARPFAPEQRDMGALEANLRVEAASVRNGSAGQLSGGLVWTPGVGTRALFNVGHAFSDVEDMGETFATIRIQVEGKALQGVSMD